MALFAGCAMGAFPAPAQTGELKIEVRDASGAAVESPGTLTSISSGVSRNFATDAGGSTVIPGLNYGSYRVEVKRTGFAAYSGVVQVNSASATRTITLEVSAGSFKVDVVGVTPLPGVEVPISEIPAPVQTLSARDLANSGAVDLSELMNRRLNAVHINENQSNIFQPDVNYRGYTASPLLGTPEGISVYVDGVRVNQPFGDIVSWDLIPKVAISEIALIPGSNPVFGLNTLGGALSLQTKSGASRPGTSLTATGGSFGRRGVEFDHGWSNSKGFNWYAAGNLFHDDGWRVISQSDVRQAFSRVGWQGSRTAISLTGSYADNELRGNGLQESRLLARDYTSAYTLYDQTNNRAPSLNLIVQHAATPTLALSGNAYFRYIRADTFNGDVNEGSLDQSVYQPSAADQAALRNAGYTGFPTSGANAANTPFPFWRCIAQALQGDEPGEKCNGLINRTYTRQHNWGASGQGTLTKMLGGRRNQFTFGLAHDRSTVGFQQTGQLGYLNPDRTVTPVNAIADGVHAGTVDNVPFDLRVNLHGNIHTNSLFFADTLQLSRTVTVTVTGRFNRTVVDNRDQILASGPGSLTGKHTFTRFNPSAGFTWAPHAAFSVYGSYSEGNRAPTAIELGCADPNEPCKLPNSFAGDPPLNQVVTRTVEAGIRSSSEKAVSWNAGYFTATNSDDILFVSSTATGFGYFKNFGSTRRQGVETSLRGRLKRLTLGGDYTFLHATFETPEVVGGVGNSANDLAAKGLKGQEGVIQIKPGNRIPMIPQHVFKAFAEYQPVRKLSVGLDFRAIGTSFARGNENNLSRPDGVIYLGPGQSPGYGVTNLGARYQVIRQLQAFVQVNNLFDHRYYTGALIGPTAFNAAGNFVARPFPVASNGAYPIPQATFYAPGAPRSVSGGLRLTF